MVATSFIIKGRVSHHPERRGECDKRRMGRTHSTRGNVGLYDSNADLRTLQALQRQEINKSQGQESYGDLYYA
jgi:hypothetical protein